MKNCDFCEDMSKSKNANLIVYHLSYTSTKMSYFSVFWVELCKSLEKGGQEIKMSTHIKKFYFWVKLGGNTFVIEWFAGINCIILWSQI